MKRGQYHAFNAKLSGSMESHERWGDMRERAAGLKNRSVCVLLMRAAAMLNAHFARGFSVPQPPAGLNLGRAGSTRHCQQGFAEECRILCLIDEA